jgi:hypothetical protein
MHSWGTLTKFFRAIRRPVLLEWQHPTGDPEKWIVKCDRPQDYDEFLKLADCAGRKLPTSPVAADRCSENSLAEPNHSDRWYKAVRDFHALHSTGTSVPLNRDGVVIGTIWTGHISDASSRSAKACEFFAQHETHHKSLETLIKEAESGLLPSSSQNRGAVTKDVAIRLHSEAIEIARKYKLPSVPPQLPCDWPPGSTYELSRKYLESVIAWATDLKRPGADLARRETSDASSDTTPRVHPPVVFPLHGIRTRGEWIGTLSDVLSTRAWRCRQEGWDFGWFWALQLLMPWARESRVRWFRKQYTNECENTYVGAASNAYPSIVAHSFGTYILGNALLKYDNIRFNKVIVVGSILPRKFPWDRLLDRGQIQEVRCEYGARDIWTKLCAWLVPGTGAAGRYGFGCKHPRFEQDKFQFDHSEYFDKGHVNEHWLPFLTRSVAFTDRQKLPVERPRGDHGVLPWILQIILYLLLALAGVVGWSLLRPSDHQGSAKVLDESEKALDDLSVKIDEAISAAIEGEGAFKLDGFVVDFGEIDARVAYEDAARAIIQDEQKRADLRQRFFACESTIRFALTNTETISQETKDRIRWFFDDIGDRYATSLSNPATLKYWSGDMHYALTDSKGYLKEELRNWEGVRKAFVAVRRVVNTRDTDAVEKAFQALFAAIDRVGTSTLANSVRQATFTTFRTILRLRVEAKEPLTDLYVKINEAIVGAMQVEEAFKLDTLIEDVADLVEEIQDQGAARVMTQEQKMVKVKRDMHEIGEALRTGLRDISTISQETKDRIRWYADDIAYKYPNPLSSPVTLQYWSDDTHHALTYSKGYLKEELRNWEGVRKAFAVVRNAVDSPNARAEDVEKAFEDLFSAIAKTGTSKPSEAVKQSTYAARKNATSRKH